jgi:hypothetical protein
VATRAAASARVGAQRSRSAWRFGSEQARRIDRPALYIGGSESGQWFAEVRDLIWLCQPAGDLTPKYGSDPLQWPHCSTQIWPHRGGLRADSSREFWPRLCVSELLLLAGAGCTLAFTHPQQAAAAMAEFLRRHPITEAAV